MDDIILDFFGPYKFVEGESYLFNSEHIRKEGIYIWTIKDQINKINYVHYIGETTSLGKRHREHIIHITGLNYGIWDSDQAEKGISEIIWKGMWRDRSNNAIISLLDNYSKMNEKIKDYIGIINIYFAPTALEKDLRKHIEGCIGWNFRHKFPDLKPFYPDDNHIGTKANRIGSRLIVNLPEDIAGIEREQII